MMKKMTIASFEDFIAAPELAYKVYRGTIKVFDEMTALLDRANEQTDKAIVQTRVTTELTERALAALENEQRCSARLRQLLVKLEKHVFGGESDRLNAELLIQLRIDVEGEKGKI